MTKVFDTSYYTALFNWAFEPPPIARPAREIAAVRINLCSHFPEILADDVLQPVLGVTPSGWLSTTSGWYRFVGDPDALSIIAKTCSSGQQCLLSNYAGYESALRHHRTRVDDVEIGGLRVIILEGRQRVVRLADIVVLDVRAAIYKDLNNDRPVFGTDLDGMPRINTASPGYLDAELWWFWSRNWTG